MDYAQPSLSGQAPRINYDLTHHTVRFAPPYTAKMMADTGGAVTADGLEVPFFRWPEVAKTTGLRIPEVDHFLASLASTKTVPAPVENGEVSLYHHQRTGVNFLYTALTNMGYAGLHDEQGLGKTLVAITLTDLLAYSHDVQKVLVLCPPYLVRQWAREILRFSPEPVLAIPGSWPSPRKVKLMHDLNEDTAIAKTGPGRLVWRKGAVPRYVVMGYDALRSGMLMAAAMTHRWDVAIMDEITNIYNYQSKRGARVRSLLGQSRMRLGMTGTPVMNRPMDVWAELGLLSGVMPSEDWFQGRYCIMGKKQIAIKGKFHEDGTPVNYTLKYVRGWRKRSMWELANALERPSIRRLRTEATDLPPIQYRAYSIPMNGNQKAAYRRLAEDGSALIGGHLIQPSNDLALRTYQRIAADGLQHWGVNSSGKADVIVQMIQDSEGTPTLVFTSWKALAHNIHARLEDAGVRSGVVTGDEGDAGRDLTCSMFQDGKLDVVVAVYDVMQFGLNLQRATHAILAGLQYNPKKMEQSIARGSRIGGGSLLVTLLISEDSVEEEVHENVVRPKLKLTETLRVAGDIERIMAADTTEYEWVR